MMKLLANLKTVQKLALGFGLLLAALIAVGYVGVSTSRRTEANLDNLYHRDLASVIDIRRAQSESIRMGRCARHALIEPDDKTIKTEISHLERSDVLVRKLLDGIEARMSSPAEKEKVIQARKTHAAYAAAMREMLLHAKQRDEAHAMLTATKPLVSRLEELVTSIDETKSRQAEESFQSNQREAHTALLVQLAVIVLAILVGVASSILIARAIAQPLSLAASVLRSVADGDLTKRVGITSRDETGQMAVAIDDAIDSMSRTLSQVRAVASDVSSFATELSTSSQDIANGSQAQAASLEETAASLDEITATVHRNTENAQTAAALATGSRDGAEKGGRVAESAILAMNEITTSSMKINDIVATIDAFAFQTNLLALNAAVEAARAGDQGRGFAVIAAEVRDLAQQSTDAAKKIKGLVNDALAKVQTGGEFVTASASTLHGIVTSIRQVTDMVGEIAVASREQLAGVTQANAAVIEVDRVTQTNASQTSNLAATAEQMAAQAAQLHRLVAMFQLDETPPAARSAPHGGSVVHLPQRGAAAEWEEEPARKVANAGRGR